MSRPPRRPRTIAALLIIASASFAHADGGAAGATVSGAVEDSVMKACTGATVVVHDAKGATVASTITGDDGSFTFSGLPPGDYTIEATKKGLEEDHAHIQITAGGPAPPPVELTLVSGNEVVEIHADWSVPPPSKATGSVASVDRQALSELPGAEDRPITDVIATQPGFVPDALGNVYARGAHGDIQYQIDGIPIPDSVGSLFAASIPVRLVKSVDIYTGGMPAELGDRMGAVVDMKTREGEAHPEGAAQLRYGSYDTIEPGAYYATGAGPVGVFVGGSYLSSQRALDPPSIDPILHDTGSMGRLFARVDDQLGRRDRVEAFATYAHNRFQIPLDPNVAPFDPSSPRPPDRFGNPSPPYVPHDTDATETEDELFATVSYRHENECGCALQIAPYYKLSRGVLFADAAHALGPTADPGATASDVDRRAQHGGGVIRYEAPRGAHVWKTGAQVDYLLGTTAFTQYARDPMSVASGRDRTQALSAGAYVQDTWTIGGLVLAPGVRADALHVMLAGGATDDSAGVSPRIGASYALSDAVTAHAFSGINWQPPAPLDAANAARALGVVPANAPVAYDLKPETDVYDELGVDVRPARFLRTGATAWGRYAWNQLDDTAIGSTSLLSNYNFERGRAGGVEARFDLRVGYWLSAFGNVSLGFAQGKGIASARYLFTADQLAEAGWQTLDHAQLATANLGATVRDGNFAMTALTQYGSGLRTGPANDQHVPGHVVTDLSFQYTFQPHGYPIKAIADVDNLFDARYAYRIGNGFVGSSYGAPRTVFVTLSVPLAPVETSGSH